MERFCRLFFSNLRRLAGLLGFCSMTGDAWKGWWLRLVCCDVGRFCLEGGCTWGAVVCGGDLWWSCGWCRLHFWAGKSEKKSFGCYGALRAGVALDIEKQSDLLHEISLFRDMGMVTRMMFALWNPPLFTSACLLLLILSLCHSKGKVVCTNSGQKLSMKSSSSYDKMLCLLHSSPRA